MRFFFHCHRNTYSCIVTEILAFTKKIGCNSPVTNKNINTTTSRFSFTYRRQLLWLAVVSVIAAIATHGYLLMHHYELKFGGDIGNSLCNFSEKFNCANVAASRFSELFGIPMALWGATTHIALLVLLTLHTFIDTNDIKKRLASRRNILILSGGIALTSLIMGGISAFVLHQGCPFCILTYILSFITFGSLYLSTADTSNPLVRETSSLFPFEIRDGTPLAIMAGLILIVSLVADSQFRKSYGFTETNTLNQFVQSSINEWQSSPVRQIQTISPLTKGAAVEGAIMTIVEFADFRCIHCQHAAPAIKAFVASHPDVRLEFQVWPLDGECNSAIPHNNGASCLLARIVYCANAADKGWLGHDVAFSHREEFGSVDLVRSKIPQLSQEIGISTETLAKCSDDTQTKEAVQKQAAVGTAQNLQGTPSIFVNGRPLPGGQLLPVLTEAYRVLKTK
jgi:protein-disulfide isomerase/uncharacterized membrane protein